MTSPLGSQSERAAFAAERDYRFALLVGDGDIAEGLLRLRIAERRAAHRVPIHTMAHAPGPKQQSTAAQAAGAAAKKRQRRVRAKHDSTRPPEDKPTTDVSKTPANSALKPQDNTAPQGSLPKDEATPMPDAEKQQPRPACSVIIEHDARIVVSHRGMVNTIVR